MTGRTLQKALARIIPVAAIAALLLLLAACEDAPQTAGPLSGILGVHEPGPSGPVGFYLCLLRRALAK